MSHITKSTHNTSRDILKRQNKEEANDKQERQKTSSKKIGALKKILRPFKRNAENKEFLEKIGKPVKLQQRGQSAKTTNIQAVNPQINCDNTTMTLSKDDQLKPKFVSEFSYTSRSNFSPEKAIKVVLLSKLNKEPTNPNQISPVTRQEKARSFGELKQQFKIKGSQLISNSQQSLPEHGEKDKTEIEPHLFRRLSPDTPSNILSNL